MNKISIIGVGATGSIVAEMLARLELPFDAYDFDTVESKNVINQIYTEKDVGKAKVDALKERIKSINPNLACNYFNQKVTTEDARLLKGTIFLLVDSMSSRKEIVEALSPMVDRVIETRLGGDSGRVLTFRPSISAERKFWMGTLFTDEESSESICGTVQGLYFVASHLASLAVITFRNSDTENEINDLNYGVYNFFYHKTKV
jgi:molybdopterin/thiamine biosynthesis adenylyltransferase